MFIVRCLFRQEYQDTPENVCDLSHCRFNHVVKRRKRWCTAAAYSHTGNMASRSFRTSCMLRLHNLLSLILAAVLVSRVESVAAEHDNSTPARTVSIADYQSARPLFWAQVYADGGRTLYCGRKFVSRKRRKINIEHVFPMSWVAWHLRCGQRKTCRQSSEQFNRIEADLHNLWPSLKNINKARRAYRFGLIKGEKHFIRSCDIEFNDRRRIVEPRPEARGEIARSMFYMAREHDLTIRPALGKTLKRWNRDDPVSAVERRRNSAIEKLQGNRNVYIDHPKRAEKLRF